MIDLVPRVRGFNRTWTQVLGLLDQGLLGTEHSLPEARVIFELAHCDDCERLDLRERLGIDDSFLTRVLTSLERRGLVVTRPSPMDGRRRRVGLTAAGHTAFEVLDQRSSEQIASLLTSLTSSQRRSFGDAIATMQHLVEPNGERPVSLRSIRAGDLGWVVQRHGEIYADEYGWDQSFEALVARIVADYHDHLQPAHEEAWIAEVDGVRAGCVFCCRRDDRTAQLRILLVEPWARGLGVGRRLVAACVDFARAAGYESITLWTNDVLVSARRIYEAAGFVLVDEARHHSFGHDLVGQNWQLDLRPPG